MELTRLTGAYPSPERLYISRPAFGGENVQRHVARYRFASQFVPLGAGMVLDCACGSGYGTEMLAERASHVIGVDRSDEALAWARVHHAHPDIEYVECGVQDLEYGPAQFDTVVTLETLEHLPAGTGRRFLAAAAEWVKPGGVLLASSPMLRYRGGRPYVTSPWHMNEMPRAELLAMFEECMHGFVTHYYHQEQDAFLPLLDEHTGFCIVVARKPWGRKEGEGARNEPNCGEHRAQAEIDRRECTAAA